MPPSMPRGRPLCSYPAADRRMPRLLTGWYNARFANMEGATVRYRLAVLPQYLLPWRTPLGSGNKPLSSWYPFVGAWAGSAGATQAPR